jgi:broad specificity phosphatase PhoE
VSSHREAASFAPGAVIPKSYVSVIWRVGTENRILWQGAGEPDGGAKNLMPTVYFITHPDVVIDPGIPVPDWPLNQRGRARMHAMRAQPWAKGLRRIFASSERKAREAAQILAEDLGHDGYSVIADLGENDRSATGFLAGDEFEATVNAFFAHPQDNIRGWESAVDAQARIVRAIEQAVSQAPEPAADIAIVGHGGTGSLLYCRLAELSINRRYDQPPTNGGNWFAFDRMTRKLLCDGWQSIDADVTRGVS